MPKRTKPAPPAGGAAPRKQGKARVSYPLVEGGVRVVRPVAPKAPPAPEAAEVPAESIPEAEQEG